VYLPSSKNDNRSCRYDGEIDKLGAFNYVTAKVPVYGVQRFMRLREK
jgi:hypothetical protein